MGRAIELLSGYVTAPSTTNTALTMNAGNTLQIRNAVEGSDIRLIGAWTKNQTAGVLRILSPRLHDNVQNMRFFAPIGANYPQYLPQNPQKLVSQDTLTVTLSGSATAGDLEIASLLVEYEDLPGVNARFLTTEELLSRTVNIMTVENTLATGTAGGNSGQEAINAEYDLMKANTDYALMGYTTSVVGGNIRWQGADLGNLGIGGPCPTLSLDMTRNWFVDMSNRLGRACIPVFNSANKAGILIDASQDENGVDILVTSIFAELSPA